MSQEALAELAGLSARAISDLERGVNRAPRRDTLDALLRALALRPEERGRWLHAWRDAHLATARRPAEGASPRSSGPPIDNLPIQRTGLVGREREIAAV